MASRPSVTGVEQGLERLEVGERLVHSTMMAASVGRLAHSIASVAIDARLRA